MANLKISQLEKAINVNADAYVLVVQNGKNYRMSIKEAIAAHADIKIILITYSELVELRNHDALIQGMQYRIIDYATIISEFNYHSFEYPFDIIVTAISTSKLSSVASALHRDDVSSELDAYDLSAWKLKYSLDNDRTKFTWASPTGKGVIYYLEDEFGNQAPYDFYSISGASEFDPSNISFIPKHLFPWPYTGKSYNNTIRLHRNRSGQLEFPYTYIFFDEDVHNIEVSLNSKGRYVAYNKADLFSTSLFDSEPSNPYVQSNEADGTNKVIYYIGEI